MIGQIANEEDAYKFRILKERMENMKKFDADKYIQNITEFYESIKYEEDVRKSK